MDIKQFFQKKGNSYIPVNPKINIEDYDVETNTFAWAIKNIGCYIIKNTNGLAISSIAAQVPEIYRRPHLTLITYTDTICTVYQYKNIDISQWTIASNWKTLSTLASEFIEPLIVDIVSKQKGQPGGIATLDENGYVPTVQLGNVDKPLYSIVDKLPTTNISIDKIYLVLNNEDSDTNKYKEYIYVNNKWELIGSDSTTCDFDKYFAGISNIGLHLVDTNKNVYLKYDTDGFDVATLSQHFIQLIKNNVSEFVDAPKDDNKYIRRNGTWENINADEEVNKRIYLDLSAIKLITDSTDIEGWGVTDAENIYITPAINIPYKPVIFDAIIPKSFDNTSIVITALYKRYTSVGNNTISVKPFALDTATNTYYWSTGDVDSTNLIGLSVRFLIYRYDNDSGSPVELSKSDLDYLINHKEIAIYYENKDVDTVITRNEEITQLIKTSAFNNISLVNPMIVQIGNLSGDITRLENALTYADHIGASVAITAGNITLDSDNTDLLYNIAQKHKTPLFIAVTSYDKADLANANDTISKLYNAKTITINNGVYMANCSTFYCIGLVFDYNDSGIPQINQTQLQTFIDSLPSKTPMPYFVVGDFQQIPKYNFTDNTFYDEGYESDLNDVDKAIIKIINTANNGGGSITINDVTYSIPTITATCVGLIANTQVDAITTTPKIDDIEPSALFIGCGTSNAVMGNLLWRNNGVGKFQDCFNVITLIENTKTLVISRVGANISPTLNKRDYMIVNY